MFTRILKEEGFGATINNFIWTYRAPIIRKNRTKYTITRSFYMSKCWRQLQFLYHKREVENHTRLWLLCYPPHTRISPNVPAWADWLLVCLRTQCCWWRVNPGSLSPWGLSHPCTKWWRLEGHLYWRCRSHQPFHSPLGDQAA